MLVSTIFYVGFIGSALDLSKHCERRAKMIKSKKLVLICCLALSRVRNLVPEVLDLVAYFSLAAELVPGAPLTFPVG